MQRENEAATIFPQDNEFEKQAYKRLYKAYISARYEKDYHIDEGELKYLGVRAKMLLDLAIKSCDDKIQQILKAPTEHVKK